MSDFIEGINKLGRAIDRKIKLIQRSNNETKRKWVIIGSVVMMIFVVSLWSLYLGTSLPDLALEEDNVVSEEPIETIEESESFFQVVSRGANVLYTSIEKSFNDSFEKIQTVFEKEREFEFSN